ncbi:MAG: hypothetical protein HRF43_19730, partial [Phycisphaerae bacterium]
SLAFPHPRTGEPIRVLAPLPKDFRAVLRQLRKLTGEGPSPQGTGT